MQYWSPRNNILYDNVTYTAKIYTCRRNGLPLSFYWCVDLYIRNMGVVPSKMIQARVHLVYLSNRSKIMHPNIFHFSWNKSLSFCGMACVCKRGFATRSPSDCFKVIDMSFTCFISYTILRVTSHSQYVMYSTINVIAVKLFVINQPIEVHLHCATVLKRLIKILNVRGPKCRGLNRPKSWLLMTWLIASTEQVSLCRTGKSWSYTRKIYKYLWHFSEEEWHKIHVYVSSEWFIMQKVKSCICMIVQSHDFAAFRPSLG